jgi:hypothetical protein
MNAVAEAFGLLRDALAAHGIRYAVGGSWASTAFGDPRFTNDVDVLADVSTANLSLFLQSLPAQFYFDAEDAFRAVQLGRPFNTIHMPTVLKFDIFPARAFPLGLQELDRAIVVQGSGLSQEAIRFVTPEDILLAKLHWLQMGGSVSEVQWRDIQGLLRIRRLSLDVGYLQENAAKLGVSEGLKKALGES